MFRSFRSRDTGAGASQRVGHAPATTMDSQHRVDKAARLTKKGQTGSVRDAQKLSKWQRSLGGRDTSRTPAASLQARRGGSGQNLAPSPIVTLTVGHEGRLFAAHEDVLCQASFFAELLGSSYVVDAPQGRRIALPDEEPEVFSAILEYLYKGDYYPRLLPADSSKHRRGSWVLEDAHTHHGGGRRDTPNTSPTVYRDSPHLGGGDAPVVGSVQATVYLPRVVPFPLLRDTVIYCAAGRYGLAELQRLALRKQGLQAGVDVGTILRSAQYCYGHTPESDSRLRAHYLALIIRCRKTFKRSGTMQAEMEKCGGGQGGGGGGDGRVGYGEGSGKFFFDLFVAMCNHLDDVIEASKARTPKTV